MKDKKSDGEKKKELERLMEELKKDLPEEKLEEYNELEKLFTEALDKDTRPLWKRILNGSLTIGWHLVLRYAVCLIAFGFFISTITLHYKPILFFVGAIVAIILTIFEEIPRNPLREHFISINFMMFLLILIGLYIINRDVYQVFRFSAIWVFYIMTVEVIYYLCDAFILKKLAR